MFRQLGRNIARNVVNQQRRAMSTETTTIVKFEEKWPEYAALMSKEEIAKANECYKNNKPYVYGKGKGWLKPLFPDTSMNNFTVMVPRMTEAELGPLGNGNLTQRRFNERLWQLQNDPEAKGKAYGAEQIGQLNIRLVEKQNIVYFIPAVVFAAYGSNLYRNLYVEKYNLWDMFLWETRVIHSEAVASRGW